ncbi:MAG: glycosyltransferase [Candidatus Vogelbacteria bacterium]
MNIPNRKIKVVIAINDFMVGGAQKLIVDQLKFFNNKIFDLTLITLFEFPDKKNFYGELSFDIKCLRFNFKSFYDLRSWWSLIKILRRLEPNVVCSHLFLSNTIFRLIKLLMNYKIITVEHNTYINKKRREIWIDKLLSYVTFRIVAVSRSVRDYAARQAWLPLSKFEIIYNGIDFTPINNLKRESQRSHLRRSLGFSDDEIIMVNNGRLTQQKNHTLLVAAFANFQVSHPKSKLVIIGEGSLLEMLCAQANSSNSRGSIFFLGAVKHSLALQYMYAADFFVSTSSIEGLSIAYLEALAMGLPIIATKTAGTDELIKDGVNGFFLEFDIEKIKHTMSMAIKENHTAMSESALKTVELFDIKMNVNKYADLFCQAFKV